MMVALVTALQINMESEKWTPNTQYIPLNMIFVPCQSRGKYLLLGELQALR